MERYLTRARKEEERARNTIYEGKIQWKNANMK